MSTCLTCDDRGTVPHTGRGSDGFDPCPDCRRSWERCSSCGGDGVYCDHAGAIVADPCGECDGAGVVDERRPMR